VLRDAEIRSALTEKVSLHHLGIADLLALAELLGDAPPETVLIGVVPERMDMALGLSARLRGRLPEVIDTARAVLGDWGIDSRPVAPSAAPAAA
jgi:hydrogenase maturation protease